MVNKNICIKCVHNQLQNDGIKCGLLGLELWVGGSRNVLLGLPPEDCPYRLEQLLTMPKENVEEMFKKPYSAEDTRWQ